MIVPSLVHYYQSHHTMLADSLSAVTIAGISSILAAAIDADFVNHTVTLQTAIAVFVPVLSLVWWLSRKFQSIDDKLVSLDKELKSRPCIKDNTPNCPL